VMQVEEKIVEQKENLMVMQDGNVEEGAKK
jgi:hypothetical protein